MVSVVENEETDDSTVNTSNKDLYFEWECIPQQRESMSYFKLHAEGCI